MDDELLGKARATARTILELARTDPAFKARLLASPADTLREAGLPEEAIDLTSKEIGGVSHSIEDCPWGRNSCIATVHSIDTTRED